MTKTNIPHHPSSGVRRSSRLRIKNNYYTRRIPGNPYVYAAAQMAEQEFLHPGAHVFFKRVAVQNEIDVNVVIITQISLREGLKKWVEKGRGAVH